MLATKTFGKHDCLKDHKSQQCYFTAFSQQIETPAKFGATETPKVSDVTHTVTAPAVLLLTQTPCLYYFK